MHNFGVLCWPVGRVEVLKAIRAEGEGDSSGAGEPVVYPASPFHHRLWCSCMDVKGDCTGSGEHLMDYPLIFAEVSS